MTEWRWLFVGMLAACVISACRDAKVQQRKTHMDNAQAGTQAEIEDPVRTWLQQIDQALPRPFTKLSRFDELPDGKGVHNDSLGWARRLFQANASPYDSSPPADHSVLRAANGLPDFLRHEYRIKDTRVTMLETVEYVWIRLEDPARPILSLAESQRPNEMTRLAECFLAMKGHYTDWKGDEQDYELDLGFPFAVQEGSHFSTRADAPPFVLRSWVERMDYGVRGGFPYFLCFKARGSSSGRLVFLDSTHWFDGECWAPYQR